MLFLRPVALANIPAHAPPCAVCACNPGDPFKDLNLPPSDRATIRLRGLTIASIIRFPCVFNASVIPYLLKHYYLPPLMQGYLQAGRTGPPLAHCK